VCPAHFATQAKCSAELSRSGCVTCAQTLQIALGAKDWLAGVNRAMCVSAPFWDASGVVQGGSPDGR
jgi:hypothetical protein